MSETDTLGERVYARLKADVSSGYLSVHVRLDFAELALRYNVSTTPIREAAMRLLGEGLLELHPKGGLRPVHISAIDLNALLELHGRLAALALRWTRGAAITLSDIGDASIGERARWFFFDLARSTGNEEFVRVMARLEDRLERYRRLDDRLFPDVETELAELECAAASPALLARLLRRYHKRRQAMAPRSILLAATEEV